MRISWWCSAQNAPWTWTWQPYPGVWLTVVTLVLLYAWAARRLRPAGEQGPSRHQMVSFAAGVVVFWMAADWPLGPLGVGYLASVHMLQFLLFTLVAPPLLIHGTPDWVLRAFLRRRWSLALARMVARPVIAFAIFNTTLVATHLPQVVDTLGATQLGSFGMDMWWLASGAVFWWPVLGPLPELDPLPYPARLVYLVANVFIPTVPAAFLTFADYPLYGVYELAPRVAGLDARADQQLAGLMMKIVGGLAIFGIASVLFFKWYRREARAEPAVQVGP